MDRTTSIPPRQTLRTALATREPPPRSTAPNRRLYGRTLLLARAAWLAVAAFTGAVYIAGVRGRMGEIYAPCQLNQLSQLRAVSLCQHGRVLPAVQRAFADLHLSVGFYGWYDLGLNVFFALGFAAVATLIFWRRSHDPLALFISLTLVVFGVGSFEGGVLARGLPAMNPGWRLPVEMLGFLGEMAFAVFIAIFPDGRFVPRWTRLALLTLILWWAPNIFFPGSPLDFTTWPAVAYFGGWAVLLSTMGAAQIYRYRRVSTPVQRLQTKWVVFGFVAAAVGYFGGRLIAFFLAPALTSPGAVLADLTAVTLIYATFLLIPFCIGIAVLRHHLFDVDVIIRRTLVYTLLAATLALLYECGALVLEQGLLALTGQENLLASAAASFGVGALAAPLHRRIERGISRVFYTRKYEVERRIEAFSQQLRREWDLVPPSEEWEEAAVQRMERAWAAVWHRPSPTRRYIQEPLFP